MIPPLQSLLIGSPAVTALVGARVWLGQRPEDNTEPGAYIVWGYVSANANNNLSTTPDSDDIRLQIDCWSLNQAQCTTLAFAVRDAVEPTYNLVSGPIYFGIEDGTKLHRWVMEPYVNANR